METFIQAVSEFFTNFSVPESVLTGVILPLFKGKGAKANNKDNYKGITLFPTLCKIYEMVLLKANLHDAICITTCSIHLISHRVNAKIAPTSVMEVKETRLSLHVGPTSCYYKSDRVNWPLAH